MLYKMEHLQRDFLWGSGLDKRRIHLVGRDNICSPVSQRGLGIHQLKVMNIALLSKWLWRFNQGRNAWWRRMIQARYGEERHGWSRYGRLGLVGCGIWKSICKGLGEFFSLIKFKVNKGNRVKFWLDA